MCSYSECGSAGRVSHCIVFLAKCEQGFVKEYSYVSLGLVHLVSDRIRYLGAIELNYILAALYELVLKDDQVVTQTAQSPTPRV